VRLEGERVLVRIFLGESDRRDGLPLYEAIVQRARERGLAGATVLRGIEGFGARSRIHRASILRLSEDLPIVVELVDARDKVEPFLEELEPWIEDGMVTLEPVEVVVYRARRDAAREGDT
jgi:PII-like signaling protein